ncbi:putative Ig domain-containing protein [Paenarthrobacter sp. NPDC089989]|uniref:Ig domain-containing protein n=1 Tax=unclassified Paenarthrobacter TaxID=2634190 RepID=UPI0038216E5F
MGAMLGERGYFRKAMGLVLAAAVAGGLALQFAPPGVAEAPVPSVGVATQTARAAVEPLPTSQPTESVASPAPIPTEGAAESPGPEPTASVPAGPGPGVPALLTPSPAITTASPAEVPATGSAGPDQTPAADPDPLMVQGYVDWGYVGKPFDAPLVITGGTGPYMATATNVPQGLTFDEANLRFVGTPTTANFAESTVTVRDSSLPQQVVTKSVSVTIWDYQPPVISVASNTGEFQDAIVGLDYTSEFQIYTSGSLPFMLELASGVIPPGLFLTGKTVSGIPTSPGTYAFTVRASDQYSSTDASFSITVRASAPYAVGYVVPPAVLGEPYSAKIASVTGGVGPYSMWWGTPQHMAGSLHWHDPGPDGLIIDGNGFLMGTPTRAGTFSVYVKFRDAGLIEREIFWTTVTVLETRPPAVEQPPAAQPPAAAEAPQTTVLPAGAVEPASSAELAATGLRSGTLNAMLWAAAGALAGGALLAASARRRWRRDNGA